MKSEPKLKELARRLLALEAAEGHPAGAVHHGAFRVFEKLRLPLVSFLGVSGFRALVVRAVALASVDIPWLRGLSATADGSVEGLAELEAKLARQEISRGQAALVAQLAKLLVTFIGPALTVGLLRDVWPKGSFDDLNLGE